MGCDTLKTCSLYVTFWEVCVSISVIYNFAQLEYI